MGVIEDIAGLIAGVSRVEGWINELWARFDRAVNDTAKQVSGIITRLDALEKDVRGYEEYIAGRLINRAGDLVKTGLAEVQKWVREELNALWAESQQLGELVSRDIATVTGQVEGAIAQTSQIEKNLEQIPFKTLELLGDYLSHNVEAVFTQVLNAEIGSEVDIHVQSGLKLKNQIEDIKKVLNSDRTKH